MGWSTVEPILAEIATPNMDRSARFHAAVIAAVRGRMSADGFEDMARRHPNGCASKYLTPTDRLREEIERSSSKVTAASEDELVTEDAAAQRFAEIYRNRLRYCHDTGRWFEWDSAIWRRDRTGIAFQWARSLARELVRTESHRIRYATSRVAFASGVERFARSDPTFAVTIDAWDQDPWLLGTPAGTVDLRSGVLRAAAPADGITRSTAVAPAEQADCPLWRRFLKQATDGDHDLIRFLQQWVGYCLTGDTREQALLFVHGPGGNGKTVFINVVAGILNDYATTAPMETFAATLSDRHPTDLAMLRGARLVTASETEEGRPWAVTRIKQMTGGDLIPARFMRQDFFTYRPQFKLTIVGNHKPFLRIVDEAARRRFNIVPFVHKPAQPDQELEQKLKVEWPAILRWAVEGCLDWQKNGLVRPDSVRMATEDYFSGQDLFGQWIVDECDAEPGNAWKWEPAAVLFECWSNYAKAAGEAPGTRKLFADAMQARGFERCEKGHAKTRGFRGLRLKPKGNGFGAAS